MTEQELLKVLDMKEDSPEQYGWLLSTIREHEACCPADLAFKWKDKVCGEVVHFVQRFDFEMAMRLVCDKSGGGDKSKGGEFLTWLLCEAEPIHWIIAALIAKDKKDG